VTLPPPHGKRGKLKQAARKEILASVPYNFPKRPKLGLFYFLRLLPSQFMESECEVIQELYSRTYKKTRPVTRKVQQWFVNSVLLWHLLGSRVLGLGWEWETRLHPDPCEIACVFIWLVYICTFVAELRNLVVAPSRCCRWCCQL